MSRHRDNNTSSQIRRVTVIGLVINVLLSILKISAGILLGSIALIADGLHSFSDMVTDFAVLIGAIVGAKEPDRSHSYGHGWAEAFSAFFIAVVLAAVGVLMIYRPLQSIIMHRTSHIGMTVFSIAVVSIIAKEFSYQITKQVAVRLSSAMLYANAWHHRSDAMSSLAVALGAIASMLGYRYADQFAAIIVGCMIVFVALRIAGQSLMQFTERSVDLTTQQQICGIIASQPDICGWHKLRTRTVGRELFMDLHIMVSPDLNITQAHNISNQLEKSIHSRLSRPVNITVHIEPERDKFGS